MTVNKYQWTAQRRLPKELQNMKQQLRAIKQPQPLGADVLSVINFASTEGVLVYTTTLTLTPGQQTTLNITFTPINQVLTLWNVLPSVYIDANLTQANLYGGIGNSLSTGQKDILWQPWLDWADSGDVVNKRVFKTVIRNNDTATHTYYYYVNAYLPDSRLVGAA